MFYESRSQEGVALTEREMVAMGDLLAELTRAYLLHMPHKPSAIPTRTRRRGLGEEFIVTDGPFTEAKEVFGFDRSQPARG